MNNDFIEHYTSNGPAQRSTWLGYPAQKCPTDAWMYQEIIYSLKPDVIVECGTANGGGALFLANMCDLVGNGRILTIEVKEGQQQPKHKRIKYFVGSTLELFKEVKNHILPIEKVMVILDSDHRYEHVKKEIELYWQLVSRGQYLIVEDTFWNDNKEPGPSKAVEEFLINNNQFKVVESKFLLTYNPGGYLKRNDA